MYRGLAPDFEVDTEVSHALVQKNEPECATLKKHYLIRKAGIVRVSNSDENSSLRRTYWRGSKLFRIGKCTFPVSFQKFQGMASGKKFRGNMPPGLREALSWMFAEEFVRRGVIDSATSSNLRGSRMKGRWRDTNLYVLRSREICHRENHSPISDKSFCSSPDDVFKFPLTNHFCRKSWSESFKIEPRHRSQRGKCYKKRHWEDC